MRLAIFVGAVTVLSGTQQVLAAAAPSIDAANPAFSLFRVLGAFFLVIALFLGGTYAFRHWQRFAHFRGKNPRLNICEVRALGNRHALYVVGYDEQRLLLASSPTGISLLTPLPSETRMAETPAAAEATSPTFLQTLQRFTQAKT